MFQVTSAYAKKISSVFSYSFYSQTGFRDNYRHCKEHGSYTAGARHGMCELASILPCTGNVIFLCVLKEFILCHIRQMTRCVCVCLCVCVFFYKLDVHRSFHHNTNRIDMTKKMRPCSRIYYSNVS